MKSTMIFSRRTSARKARECHAAVEALYPGAKLGRDERGLWQVTFRHREKDGKVVWLILLIRDVQEWRRA